VNDEREGMKKTMLMRVGSGVMLIVFVALLLSALQQQTAKAESAAGRLKEMTGARTKVVWVQDLSDAGNDTFARGESLRLMGLDTNDRKGERAILSKLSNYSKPLITPSGDKVVYSDLKTGKAYVVGWNGKGLKEISRGFAFDVWLDPKTGLEWAYVGTSIIEGRGTQITHGVMKRFRIDDPSISEMVWDKGTVDADNFQLSADGTRASSLFPWPHGGIVQLQKGDWEKVARGCWPSLAPDNSYLFWIFDGAHRNITLYPSGPGKRRKVNLSKVQGIDGFEVYHPRWSNHVRYMVMTGPYTAGGGKPGGNRILSGGTAVEIYVGRFDGELGKIEQWTRVTHNELPDFFPDVWIEGGEKASVAQTMTPEKPNPKNGVVATKKRERIVVKARQTAGTQTPTPEDIAPYLHCLAASEFEVLEVLEGECNQKKIAVNHWVIRDKKVLPQKYVTGKEYKITIEPMADHPELESERLVSDLENFELPEFHEIGY
jgi:hypothetical protein